MPDYSVTSDTRLTPDARMPMPDWGNGLPEKCRCWIIFFRRFNILAFTYDISASYSRVVYLSTTCSLGVQWVYLSPPSIRMDVQGAFIFHSQKYNKRVYTFPPPAMGMCRVYPSPWLAVCMCRVYVSFFTFVKCKCRNVGLFGIWSVQYRNEQKCRCWHESGTGIRGI